jgi:hypothetical protein
MIKHTLVLSTVLFACDANAGCLIDAPEIGDIGPSSEIVCRELERRFPGSILTVEGRSIHSAQEVSVQASVNSEPVALTYSLDGFAWHPSDRSADVADKDRVADGRSMR